MTLCRWFHILDPAELRRRMTSTLYYRWLRYFKRNACHPLAVPMTLGINSYITAGAAGKDNIKDRSPRDFVAYLPRKTVNVNDPDAMFKAMIKGAS